jgi:hypothetical protein
MRIRLDGHVYKQSVAILFRSPALGPRSPLVSGCVWISIGDSPSVSRPTSFLIYLVVYSVVFWITPELFCSLVVDVYCTVDIGTHEFGIWFRYGYT